MKKKLIIVISILIVLVCGCFIIKPKQKELVARNKKIIKKFGYDFKDLNGNGKVDIYENWMLSSKTRAKDLVSKMTLEEKAGIVLANTQYTTYTQNNKELTSHDGLLNEEGSENNPVKYLKYAGNTETIVDKNIRHILTYEDIDNRVYSKWINAMNEVAESTRLGVPVLLTANGKNVLNAPKNNFNIDNNNTYYPANIGISAAAMGEIKKDGKSNIIKEYAETVNREFLASGIRKGHFYTADVVTDPRWIRNHETFGEDVEFTSNTLEELITITQGGKKLNENGVAVTVKHFPGSGARENGLDAHFEFGKYAYYPTKGSLEKYHLKPFESAIKANASSVMPYYSMPSKKNAEQKYNGKKISMKEESLAYNKEFLTTLLRDEMDFEGYVTTDSGVLNTFDWGKKDLTESKKVAQAIKAGTDLIVDTNRIDWVTDAIKNKDLTEKELDLAAIRVLKEMFDLGLFENPYVADTKTKVVTKKSLENAYKVHQKSVVKLKDNDVLPLKKENIKVFVMNYNTTSRVLDDAFYNKKYNIEIVKDYKKADYFISYINGVNATNSVYELSLKKGMDKEYDKWLEITKYMKDNDKKIITVVNMITPYILDGIEQYSDVLLVGFNTYTSAILDIIFGDAKSTGVLPFTLPANEDVVAILKNGKCASPNDVPGYDKDKYLKKGMKYAYKDSNKNVYKVGFGL